VTRAEGELKIASTGTLRQEEFGYANWLWFTCVGWSLYRWPSYPSVGSVLLDITVIYGAVLMALTKANYRIDLLNTYSSITIAEAAKAREKADQLAGELAVARGELKIMRHRLAEAHRIIGDQELKAAQAKARSKPSEPPETTTDMKLFDLGWGFTREQLMKAFRGKVKTCHPDANSAGGRVDKHATEFHEYVKAKDRLERKAK
jgi:hypothetical protein